MACLDRRKENKENKLQIMMLSFLFGYKDSESESKRNANF